MVFAYHKIANHCSPCVYSPTVDRLEAHLRTLIDEATGVNKRPTIVTFDGGHVSQYKHALPGLQKFDKRAIFFVRTGWTGRAHDYMTPAQYQGPAQ